MGLSLSPFFLREELKMTKTYQSIRFTELHLTIFVTRKDYTEPQKETVDFIGGSTYPRQANGTYTTNDKEIQAQLEKNDGFKKDYRLLFKDGNPVYKEPANKSVEDKLRDANKLNTVLSKQIKNFTDGDNSSNEKLLEYETEIENLEVEVSSLKHQVKVALERIKELEDGFVDTINEKIPDEDQGPIKAEGIINMQAARQYLIKKHGQDIRTMKNGQEVLLVAKKLGIVFPDWHPKS